MELMKKRLMNNFDMTVPFAKVYGMENDEFCFLKHFDMITEDIVDAYIEMLISSIDDMVKLRDDHMSTIITGIIVADSVDDKNLDNIVKRFKHQKSYFFGLKGWVDVRLILVDLQGKRVVPSKKAVKVETFYRP